MTEVGVEPWLAFVEIAIVHFILPAVIAFGVSEAMRKLKLIKNGDMKLEV